jgi:transaldolase / glucose-6-phosphate isomerase
MAVTVSLGSGHEISGSTATRWERDGLLPRMWQRDPTVWFDPPRPETANRLGWLDLPASSERLVETIRDLAEAARAEGITDLVLCGMGGSSLAPEVFASTLPHADEAPRLTVMDTTHPDRISAITAATDPHRTWYLISSKSGGTLETLSLFRHFWATASAVLDEPGSHFLAVTDPDSSLEQLATDRGFRATITADPDVGGRYSALSAFGLVPAGITGADIPRLLRAGRDGASQCGPHVSVDANPGFLIGVLMGTMAVRGRMLVRFDASSPVSDLPAWIEQLIAESTGKEGTGIVPIADGPEPPEPEDALTVSIGATPDPASDVAIELDEPYDVAAVMFILEVATAVAGEVLGINPFDQPDVQLAKSLAHEAVEGTLSLDGLDPMTVDDPDLPARLARALAAPPRYVSIQAYVDPTDAAVATLDEIRDRIVDRFGVLTTVGFGPRYLHSTGQLHKGGPTGGVFIQIVDTPRSIVPVPETTYTFNDLIAAQASGDRAALADRGRTVVSIDLDTSPISRVADAVVRSAAG